MKPAALLAQRDTQRTAFARRLADRDARLIAARNSLAEAWERDVSDAEASEHLAQAVAAVGLRSARVVDWVSRTAEPWARVILDEAASLRDLAGAEESQSPFERLQSRGQKGERRRRGVFFTPPALVHFVVRGVDDLLREEFAYADGLATDSAELRILDPACGTGYFLEETLRVIFERRPDDASFAARLLPRIAGLELLPGACLVARLQLAERFLQWSIDPANHPPPRVELGNALAGPTKHSVLADPCTVLIGNPPYRGLSENHSPWITQLLRDYKQIDGEPLRERKHWLHDDYVKFFRLAQRQIESVGRGLIAFVTNHGFLDNAGFRGMRRSLMTSLPRISVVDLHGNRKAGETAPGGGRDDNVFGIEQGVAVTFLRRTSAPPRVTVADVWGSSADKQTFLSSSRWDHSATVVVPQTPDYSFRPRVARPVSSAEESWRLCDAIPANTTAPVTARDGFVIAFTREELVARLTEFCDLALDDDFIRGKYLQNSRSHRYPAGDTRGWKLSAVRRRLAAEPDLLACLRPCLYRPFDIRWIAWHPALIDWPRPELTRHLLDPELIAAGQLCLIARRQTPPGRSPTYFLVSDLIPLDGVIRSDNRGSESLFPLFVRDECGEIRPNFAPAFLDAVANRVQTTFTPFELAAYIYGLWHTPTYRSEQADSLQRDFPRIPLPRDAAEFATVSAHGARLIAEHREATTAMPLVAGDPMTIAPRYPRFEGGVIHTAPHEPIGETTAQAWNYTLGSHQVLYKWLADRRGRRLTAAEVTTYRRIIRAIEITASVSFG